MQTFTGLEYLKIDIANNAGKDKLKYKDRIDWFDKNYNSLIKKDNQEIQEEIENPCLLEAGLLAYQRALDNIPSGYPISLDATASGTQILACLSKDISAATISNVIPNINKDRQDSYSIIYEAMCEVYGSNGGKIKREDIKKAIMTSLYGSTAKPEEVFGKGDLLDLFYKTVEVYMPYVWKTNKLFLNIWREDLNQYGWVLPDNFHVVIKVNEVVNKKFTFNNRIYDYVVKENKAIKHGRALSANIVHSIDGLIVREICYLASLDKNKILNIFNKPYKEIKSEPFNNVYFDHYHSSLFVSSRIIDNLEEIMPYVLGNELLFNLVKDVINMIPEKPFEILTVHDSFRVLPNYGNDLRKLYNYQLNKIWNSNLLNFIVSQYLEKKVNISFDNFQEKVPLNILESDYSLC